MMQAIVLAAGKGTRMRSGLPKVLHPVLGKPLLEHVLETLAGLGICSPRVIIGNGAEQVRSFLKSVEGRLKIKPVIVLQKEQLGTGHAVMMAEKSLRGFAGDVLIWPGDMPLLERATLRGFIREHGRAKVEASVLSSLQVNPAGYGRILRAGGRFYAIREELDATEAERRIQEVNSGVYLFRAKGLFKTLKKIRPQNSKKEFYLTDTIEILSKGNGRIAAFPLASGQEGQGINDRLDLARVTGIMKNREIEYHAVRGVTFVAPDQTFVAKDVRIGEDTVIYPWCYIESDVKIGSGCQIGPFAKIRKGTVIGDGSVIGSFVEINRTRIGRHVNAKHLTYLGDAVIGDGANIGAGTITANYDGKHKSRTMIGKKAFIGSNTVLVAPVTVGHGAGTGAGSVVTKGTHVKSGEVVVGVPARPIHSKKKRA